MLGKLHMPSYVQLMFKLYLTLITLFGVMRCLFYVSFLERSELVPTKIVFQSFFMGWRFDNVITAYLLSIPFLVLFVFSFFSKTKRFMPWVFWFVYIEVIFALLISIADITYFQQFNIRLNSAFLNWIDDAGFILSMIYETPLYLLLFICFLLVVYFLKKPLKKWFEILKNNEESMSVKSTVFWFFLMILLLFVSIRGRIEPKSPIRWGTAFFSEYSFANQMGLNPVFTLIRSSMDDLKLENKKVNLMAENEALSLVKSDLNITGNEYSLSRWEKNTEMDSLKIKNIVLVLMESMAAGYMGVYGHDSRTPYLDDLADKSLFFNRCFSSGIHTYNGIYSSLHGMPSLFLRHHLKDVKRQKQPGGLAKELKSRGFFNTFLMTHDSQFDNVGGFVVANDFDEVISKEDFPEKEVLSTLGVPDHVLFEKAFQLLNSEIQSNHNSKKKFLSILTGSNHTPEIIPEGIEFKPRHDNLSKDIVEYADWAVQQFMEKCSKENWFDSTLFIFTGDHGRTINPVYDMDLSYHHIPLIYYQSGSEKMRQVNNSLCGQIDIFPTTMAYCGYSYNNEVLGKNVFQYARNKMVFTADDKFGCINDSLFSIVRTQGEESLFKYVKRSGEDFKLKYPVSHSELKKYAEAYLQVTEMLMSQANGL